MKKALTSHKNFYNSKSVNKLVPYKLIKSDYDITAFFGQPKEVSAHRPTHYRKKAGKQRLTQQDWIRIRKRAMESVKNNFVEGSFCCYYLTLKIKDQRIKAIKTVKKMVRSFGNSIPCIKAWTAIIELNYLGHPHVHMLVQTSKPIPEDKIVSGWSYGFSYVKSNVDNFERIINYSIKTRIFTSYDKDIAKSADDKYWAQISEAKEKEKLYSSEMSKLEKDRLHSEIDNSYRLAGEIKGLLKAYLQTQLKESPLVTSYGQKHYKAILNEKKLTVNDLISDDYEYEYSQIEKLNFYNDKTGEILGKSFYNKAKFSRTKLSKIEMLFDSL